MLSELNSGAERRLRRWMAASFQSRSYERFDGLPIDRIATELAEPTNWLVGGATVFMAARAIRNKLKTPLTVTVTFDLVPARRSAASRPTDASQIAEQLSEEPPAVALFPSEPGFLDDSPTDSFNPALLVPDPPADVRAIYREWSFPGDEAEGLFRSLLLYSLPSASR